MEMENESLPSVVWDNITTPLSDSEDVANYLVHIRDLILKVIYIIIGTLGVVDNLFVLIVFFSFIKISQKVCNTVYN